MKIENVKAIKTTVLGLLFISVGVYLILQSITFDYYILGALFISGLLLLFSPDTLINLLEKKTGKLISNKLKKAKEETE